jgi:hypothetical protein
VLEKMMRSLLMVMTTLLRIIATVLVQGWLIWTLLIAYVMMCSAHADGVADRKTLANIGSLATYAAAYSILLFPTGVCLHWIIAKKTKVCPYWVWWAILLGSLLMCLTFPVGTILGVVAIRLLFASDTFRRRQVTGTGTD